MDQYEIMERNKELQALQVKQEAVRMENTLLSEHLSRIVTRKGSLQLHLEKMEEEETEKEEQEAAEALRRSSRRSFRIFHDGPPVPRATVRFLSPPKIPSLSPPKQRAEALPMSTEEKVEIADEECGHLTDQVEKLRAENDRCLDDLGAVYNEVKRGMRETKKEKNSFYREVILLSEINPGKVIYAEDVLRKQNVRDKLQEKNDLLHMEIMEAEHQFSTKKDLKDILHAIDFDQLQIQNVQLHARIRDRTYEIWDLKSAVKRTLKSKLHESVVAHMQEEDGPPRPTALDYMRCRHNNDELSKEVKTWKNKVEVAELTNIQLHKMLRQALKNREVSVRQEASTVVAVC
ncbi:coiled-coil domain-containing protein 113-like [Selaginella moellendorffii]|uniref:coiled-coil domain-containing protein 113-like n=1 Tax=Selaginella moellendorffii TaxID=88036 RepID=UPI000D1C408D|nr:coiled-coil domain-containing protein 113-like [Selaginella moellendorffii]|eukprot:XP_024531418.1 coiled-coil domain-containing protein 113-like [Selaginella moellendorffii]